MDSLASHRRLSMRWRVRVSDIREAIRTRYAAKALRMAPAGVTGRLGLACNLGTADLATRRAEGNSIDGAALIGRDEAGGVVTSTYRASPEPRAHTARLPDRAVGRCRAGASE